MRLYIELSPKTPTSWVMEDTTDTDEMHDLLAFWNDYLYLGEGCSAGEMAFPMREYMEEMPQELRTEPKFRMVAIKEISSILASAK